MSHFYPIRNFNRLLGSKYKSRFFCKSCMNGFKRRSTLDTHVRLCTNYAPQKTSTPENLIIKFKNIAKMLYHPFCVYADFECITVKYSNPVPSQSSSFTVCMEKHVPISYAILVTDIEEKIVFHEFFSGKNVIKKFLSTLKKMSRNILLKMKEIIPLNKEEVDDTSARCHICGKEFQQGDIKVRDHNHYGSGEFRGMAHQQCNLNYRSTYYIPVVIHNSKNYDSHLILKNMPRNYARRIRIIPSSMEKFVMFSLDDLRFIDSFQFLDASLDTLVRNLSDSGHSFKIFDTFFTGHQYKHLLRQKGIFPYSYVSSESVLLETVLPPKSAFYNNLNNSIISDTEYNHALAVYNAFKCKNIAQYLELYQNTDVILLAEVFSSFRRASLEHYSLDPVHFITAADLTWNAGLKYSKIELQLFKCVDSYLWIESQLRGGICMLGTRYVRANNPLIPETYDPRKPNNYILALDAVNLYGHSMMHPMPVGNFSWLTPSEIKEFDVHKCSPGSSVGYILEVDLTYPPRLHNAHDSYPLAPSHMLIKKSMLSPYAKNLCEKFNLQSSFPCKKLVPNLHKKTGYITHYLNLQFYMSQGLILNKIHRILSFTQKPFLKEYISFNNEKRQASNNEFERNFFKKMNNSFFGKTMQSPRKKCTIKASLNVNDCRKYLASPLLENFSIVNNDFSIFKFKRANLILDKPIFVGFTILEMSKLRMYELYYSHFKPYYNDRVELIYTDTDSLFLNIETQDVYRDLKTHFANIMDHSNFPTTHTMYNVSNAGKLGCLKHETTLPIREFVGLKCKMYAIAFGEECKKRAKGVRRNCLKNIDFKTYINVLESGSFLRHETFSILSKKHEISTVLQNKISLSSFYDKRYMEADGINSRSYGHYTICADEIEE